jgi:hypothetical protein
VTYFSGYFSKGRVKSYIKVSHSDEMQQIEYTEAESRASEIAGDIKNAWNRFLFGQGPKAF